MLVLTLPGGRQDIHRTYRLSYLRPEVRAQPQEFTKKRGFLPESRNPPEKDS
jgi:hypothetical protein